MVSLQNRLARMGGTAKRDRDYRLRVGYTAEYAFWVHEDLEALHAVGQAKFLEQPAREYRFALQNRVVEVYRSTKSLKRAVYSAAVMLLDLSQPLVPVDTGYLRSSGEVRVEQES